MATPKTATATITPINAAVATTVDTTAWADLGTNLKYHITDGILFLAIPVPTDKSKLPITAGSSDKPTPKQNRQVASSHGNVVVPGTGGLKLGMNAFIAAH